MSNDLNQCNFIGRLGKDPELKALQSGESVTSFNLACGWKSKNSEGVEWVTCVAFGRLAEIVCQYTRKGSRVFISGKFRTRKWTDKDGNERYNSEIVAREMQMLDSKQDGQAKPAQDKPAQDGLNDAIPF